MITIYDDDIDHGMAMVDYYDSLVLRKLYSDCMTKFICVNDTAERNLLNFFFLQNMILPVQISEEVI